MSDELVRIYSGEHGTYWRPGGNGYTAEVAEAGVWPRGEAERIASGCGYKKRLELLPVKGATDEARRRAEQAADEIVNDHLRPCGGCFGDAMPDVWQAIVEILIRHMAA